MDTSHLVASISLISRGELLKFCTKPHSSWLANGNTITIIYHVWDHGQTLPSIIYLHLSSDSLPSLDATSPTTTTTRCILSHLAEHGGLLVISVSTLAPLSSDLTFTQKPGLFNYNHDGRSGQITSVWCFLLLLRGRMDGFSIFKALRHPAHSPVFLQLK